MCLYRNYSLEKCSLLNIGNLKPFENLPFKPKYLPGSPFPRGKKKLYLLQYVLNDDEFGKDE